MMEKVRTGDILNLVEYERIRPEFRSRIVEMKKNRRLPLGDLMTLVFENRDTVLFQIQEMIRVERIVEEKAIKHEVDTYNILVPDRNELSATLLIEIQELKRIKEILDGLVGLQSGCIVMQVGEEKVTAVFDEGQSEDDRISAVQYIKFKMNAEQAEQFIKGTKPIRMRVEHPRYRYDAEVPDPVRRALAADLQT